MRPTLLPTIAVIGALSACADLPAPAATSLLDDRTGVTVTVADEPLILARDRREQAANARDYLTLVAVARNTSGRIARYLLVHRWSTIDVRNDGAPAADAGSLVLLADGRDIQPVRAPDMPRDFTNLAGDLWSPGVTNVESVAYPMDAETMRFLATSRELSAWFAGAADARPYVVWRDGRAALRRFVEATGP